MRSCFAICAVVCAAVLMTQSTDATAEDAAAGKSAPMSADEQAIRAAGEAYRAAFAKGDVEAVAAFWTKNADLVDQSGHAYKVQAVLERARQLLSDGGNIPQPQRKSETLSIRFITPDVALEDGAFERSGAGPDESHEGRYTAVWVKRDGKWLLDGERESPVRAEVVDDPLPQLAWMVGEWTATGAEESADITCSWGPNKTYLLRQITLKPKSGPAISATQWIGWDPVQEKVRSFLFDSRGGFNEGKWTNEEDAWVVHTRGIMRDGHRSEATMLYSRIDENNWTIESLEDDIDGQPAPEINLRVTRKQVSR